MTEIWKPVPGFEGRYEISDLGNARSLDRSWTQTSRWGTSYTHVVKGRGLKPGRISGGHVTVSLGRHSSVLVHHLVLFAFVGPRPTGLEALHLDGNPINNTLANLRWGTRSENGQHKKWHASQSTYKLSPDQAASIKARLRADYRGLGVELAAEFGVSSATISSIKAHRTHRDIQ